MARIRTIKPEMWASEQIGDCSLNARLLFIGLLNFCDDNGIHPDSPRRLKAEIFPHDIDIAADQVACWLAELSQARLTAHYSVNGNSYILVTGWDRHQKIEKPTYRHPGPDGTIEKISPTIRRRIAECYANGRQGFADISDDPRPRNGMESKGVPPPSQGVDLLPSQLTVYSKIPSGINSGSGGDDEF